VGSRMDRAIGSSKSRIWHFGHPMVRGPDPAQPTDAPEHPTGEFTISQSVAPGALRVPVFSCTIVNTNFLFHPEWLRSKSANEFLRAARADGSIEWSLRVVAALASFS